MINKRSLWFLTLSSLILVLSVYYITMPSELLITNNGGYDENEHLPVDVKESTILVALRVEAEEKMLDQIDQLESVLTNTESTVEQKNVAFEKLKSLNIIRGEEESIEKLLKEEYKIRSFVKIEGDQIRVVVDGKKKDVSLANNIMRTIQNNYKNKMYITVKFQA